MKLLQASLLAGLAVAIGDGATVARSADVAKPILIELNKLEPVENRCRTYFLLQNDSDAAVEEMRLDVYIFGKDDIILERVALAPKPIPPTKSRVVPFDLDVKCDAIGRFLLNDVISCKLDPGGDEGCAGKVAVSSRAEVGFSD